MPRPHAPHEPLVVTPALRAEGASLAHGGTVRLLPDGRVSVGPRERMAPCPLPASDAPTLPAGFLGRRYLLGRDLTCLCAHTERGCAHQLLAALALGHPVAATPDADHPFETLRSAMHVVRGPIPRPTSPREVLVEQLTRPRLALLATRRLLATQPQRGVDLGLALAAGRRAGPLRQWLWERWTAQLGSPLDSSPERDAERWGDTARRFAATLSPEDLPDPFMATLRRAPALWWPVLAERPDALALLARTLPRPALATVLAAAPPDLRAALARSLHAAPAPVR